MSADTATVSQQTSPSKHANSTSKVVLASLIGTTIEFYDFYVYATAATLVFPALFFPSNNAVTSLLASYAVFGAAMVARPIGAFVFGHLGDKRGRKTTLVLSLLTMGIATFLIGLLPTYHQAGYIAPVLLLILRLVQGFALGGEWSGAALVATENAPKGKRAWFGTFPQVGAPIGFIIANGVFLFINFVLPHPTNPSLGSEQFLSWGWRVPFLFSAVMVIIGLWVRMRLVESETFTKVKKQGKVQRLPIVEVFRKNWWQIILGTFIMLATYVLFYLMTAFTLQYGTAAPNAKVAAAAAAAQGKPFDPAKFVPGLGFKYTDFVLMMILGVVFFGIFTLLSGPMADTLGRKRVVIWTTVAIIIFGLAFSWFLAPREDLALSGAYTMAFLFFGFTLMGLTFGPMGALLPELFPTATRYTGSAVAYNVSSILGAAIAPIVAVSLWSGAKGNPQPVGIYLALMGVLTLIALLLSKETKNVDLESEDL